MITGRLQDRPLARVLQDLHSERFTGELVIHARTGLVQVYVREGYPVYVNVPESGDLLGRILCEMQVLTEAIVRRSLATEPGPGQRYGDVLMQLGLCDENTLKQALRAQVRRRLHKLCTGEPYWQAGYAAIPGEHGRGMQGGESLRVHPRRVIFHAASSFSAERLRALTAPLSEQGLRLHPDEQEALGRYGFGPEENYIADLLRRGYWTVLELIEVAGYEPQRTLAAIYALWTTDAVDVAPADSVPRARENITDLPPPPPVTSAAVVDLQPAPASVHKEPSSPTIPAAQRSLSPLPTPRSPASVAARPSPAPKSRTGEIPYLEVEFKAPASRPGDSAGKVPQSRPGDPAGKGPASRPGDPAGSSPRLRHGSSPGMGAANQKRPVSFEEMALLRADIENKSKVVDDETLFAVLGVPQTADTGAVKAAFLAAAKKYHPDRIVALGLQALKDQSEKVFRRVNEAHQVLTDPARRDEYVAELRMKEASGDKDTKAKELAVKVVNAELAFARGIVFFRRRDYASAAREFEEAVRLKPDEGEHVGYLAWCRFCSGQLSAADALKEVSQALRQAKDESPRLYYFAGILFKQEDKEDRALQSFAKAAELDERIEEARTEIRLIESRRGKKGKPASTDSKGKSAPDSSKSGKHSSGDSKGGGERKMGFLERLRQPMGKK